MPLSNRFTSQLTVDWEIYFSQCYPNAALKLPELSNLMQLTANIHADLGGVGFKDLAEYDQAWVMNRMRIEILKIPVWSDEIQIRTWVEELKTIKSIRNFELTKEGEKYIAVSSLWVILNTKTRRPDSLKIDTSHVERFPELQATQLENRKLRTDFEITDFFDYKVQFADLDIVKHVNNIKYLEWCLNYLDIELILKNRIKAIDLNFIKELSLHDTVTICKGVTDNITHFKILRDDVVCFICEIELV